LDNPVKENIDYYTELYGHRNVLLHWIHGLISYDQQSKSKLNRILLMPIIRKKIFAKKEILILDYGCGWGSTLLSLPRKNIKVYAYDIIENAIDILEKTMKLLKRKLFRVELTENNIISPSGFDIIICSHVLEHVESDLALLASMKSAMHPEGYILINVPINEVWNDPKHKRHYNAILLSEKLDRHGFVVVSMMEGDRWSGFLLKHETKIEIGLLAKIGLKVLRVLLAIMPFTLLRFSEKVLLKKTSNQQLLIMAKKSNG
jgi:2-polyprenyl-3-methyl-5-hydroxy-6-metoxy-1,4-benzoquinol methylase